ncbi:AAA family ATPase [Streptomyces sp. NPDC050400]|uniref:AAA family ATPase n=1 Tax=Streptomyces sp. NPDC050400 TaxID=3365610 RepID=UPI0037996FA9
MERDGVIPRPVPTGRSTKADTGRLFDPQGTTPAVVEILGQPWMGKTRLLHRILDDARKQGWSVAHAAAGPAAGAAPYQLFSDAFDEIFADRAGTVLRNLPIACRQVLGGVFPALDLTAGPAPAPGPVAPGPMGSALRQAVRGLTESSGLVLALDDVHWADPASLDLLESLVRRPPDARLVIVVAHRDRQSPLRLRGLLASVPGTHRIELGPLPEPELDALLPEGTARPLRRALTGRAGGNPGLLLALAAAPRAYGGTAPDAPGLTPFTRFLEEFRAVTGDGWLVAQSAAVLGDAFTLHELRSLTELPAERLADAVAELLREDIVRPGELADQYRFRHSLLRATAYHSTSERWRLAAHTAATGLVPLPAPCAHGQAEPVPHRTPVADRVRSGLLPRPADHTCVPGDGTLLYAQRVRTGKALVVAGRPSEALDVLDRTASPGAEVPLVLRAEAAEWRARAQRLLGRYALAESLLDAVRPDVAGEPEALALIDLARLAAALERGTPLPGGAPPSARWATDRSDPLARAYAGALLGAQDADAGRTAQAAARLDGVAALLDGLDDSVLVGRLDPLYWLARSLARLEQDAAAARHFERGLGIAAAHELDHLVPQFATGLAEVRLRLGRVDLAIESGHRAMRAADRIGSDCLLAEAGAGLARAAWIGGDRAAALRTAREAARRAEAWREPWADRVRLSLLETTFDTGDQELCRELLSTGTVRRAASFPVVSMVPAVAEVLARLEGERRGSATEAGRWATVAEEAAGRLRLPGATGLALLARAHHHRVTDPLRAAVFASSAVVTLTRAGRPLDVVRAHLAVAAAWAGIDSAVARRQLDEAQVLLRDRGAHGYLDHTDDLATSAPAQSADARLARLSSREREISVLVSDGCTNQQIARALRLSHKTVETHLGRIFKKLDVGSRAQVATSIGRAARFTDARFADRPTPVGASDQLA